MTRFLHLKYLLGIVWALTAFSLKSQSVKFNTREVNEKKIFTLSNEQITLKIITNTLKLESDSLTGIQGKLATDAGFGLDIMWTDWLAPKKQNNADNLVLLGKDDFILTDYQIKEENRFSDLILQFKGNDYPLLLKITYRLENGKNYYRRKISVCDTFIGDHFLQQIYARKGQLVTSHKAELVKSGGFGQPIAVSFGDFSTFIGLEYPAANNLATLTNPTTLSMECSQEFGQKITSSWIESEWVVTSLLPNSYVKNAFLDYLDDIRVAPLEPFTLYNSWYDLRSPEYPGVKPDHIMNETNTFRIIDLFKKNMIDKYGIQLDAFVLDDGWDVYQSDWVLRKETFPNGMKPVADRLKSINSSLGIWFGPTGGYSFRMKRVKWMQEHGYETVGKGRDYQMLCLGGKNYSQLFEKRVTDFSRDGITYYKWDGIQFSCSEPDHGHPVGVFSRRAVLESVIDKCKKVREIHPETYLNITSGTWLSPWWTKYANQIWMDGNDYGFSDVPSVHARDASITYKDYVLYDDFHNKDLWFPISNLMTHGIIKGNLETVGGSYDPINKFTDDVVFYFARGVMMWELYISPDLLTPREWEVLSQSVTWARDRKEILKHTHMVGGDPSHAQSYAYLHFKENQGIIAARNPGIQASSIQIKLDPAFGLDPKAHSLIIEQVYPVKKLIPGYFAAGATFDIPLNGYEAAVFEIYPAGNLKNGPDISLKTEASQHVNQPTVKFQQVTLIKNKKTTGILMNVETAEKTTENEMALLVKPTSTFTGKDFPEMKFVIDGKEVKAEKEESRGLWTWYTIPVTNGKHDLQITPSETKKTAEWTGIAEVWVIGLNTEVGENNTSTMIHHTLEKPQLPLPYLPNQKPFYTKLGTYPISLNSK